MKVKGFVNLRISGTGLCNEKISAGLNISHSHFNKKGDTYTNKYTKKTITYPEDSWYAGIEAQEDETPEDMLSRFVDMLHPHSEYLNKISSSFDVTLWLSFYPDNEQMNVQLTHSTILKICDMGISMNIGAMFLKEIYEGKY